LKTKINVAPAFLFFYLILILFTNSFAQINKELLVKLEPKEVNGDSFNGKLKMTVNNNIKDTIYITMQPYYCETVGDLDSMNFYISILSGCYSPNRIYFFKKDASYSDGPGLSTISFLKFPQILCLYPGKETTFNFNFDNLSLKKLKGNKWVVFNEIWYGYKSDIDSALKNKPYHIKWEFKKSIFYKDTLNIDLKVNDTQQNSLLYIDKDNINDKSVYDLIIIDCFIQSNY
jgi:hypothetical protein